MRFAKELNEAVNEDHNSIEMRAEVRRSELFTALTEKYLVNVRDSILRAAKKGFRKKYINFNREDFKANFHGLGTPAQVQRDWLKEICNPESKYVLVHHNDGKKLTLEGINADVWNNSKFTTLFKW